MAIDVNSVKSGISSDGQYQSVKGSSGGGGINFAELMRKSGIMVSKGFMATSDRTGITSVINQTNAAGASDDRRQGPVDDYADAYDNSSRDADPAPRRAERPDSGQRDNYADDQTATAAQDYPGPTGDTSTEANSARSDNAAGQSDDQSVAADTADRPAASGDNANDKSVNGDGNTTGQSANSAEKSSEPAVNGGNNAVADQNKMAGQANAEQILQSLLATAQANTQTGKATGPAATSGRQSGPGDNAAKGLSAALANVTKNTDKSAMTAARSIANGDTGAKASATAGATVAAKDGFNLHTAQAAQAKAGGIPQSVNTGANAPAQSATAAVAESETVARQSAQLSRMVGAGPKVSIAVETAADSTAIISKPATSLISNAALIGENNARNDRGHQPQNSAGATAGQASANTAQAQTVIGQNQTSTTPLTAQNLATVTTGGDAKGLPQGPQQSAAGGTLTAATGEGAATPGNVNTTGQARSSVSAQASNAPRFATPSQAVTDQVTIQISKAFSTGADKISIHLKPSDLGRVDVKMEIGHDGRLSAIVTADNKNTLDLLQRDARELQQALQAAGLQMDNDSLSFNLRERGGDAQDAGTDHADEGGEIADGGDIAIDDQAAVQAIDIVTDNRVDIRA